MKRSFLLIFGLISICTFAASAQDVQDMGRGDQSDLTKAEQYIENGLLATKKVEIDSAMHFYRKALNIGDKVGDDLVKAKALNGIGYLYSIYLSKLDSAEIYLKKAYQLFQTTNQPELTARCLFDICDVLRSIGQRKEASQVLIEAAKINDSLGLDSINAGVYYKMAGVFFELNNTKQFNNYFDKAISIAQKYEDKEVLAVCHMYLTKIHIQEEQLDSAKYHASEALRLGFVLKDPITIGYAYKSLGSIASANGNFQKAREQLQKMLWVPKLPPQEQAQFAFYYGEFFSKFKKYEEAKKYLILSLREAKRMGLKPLQRQVLNELIQVYERLGDYQNAYYITKSYHSILEEIQNIDLKREVEGLNLKFETEKKEKEILRLEAKNVQQQLSLVEATAMSRQRFWWGLMATLFLVLLGAGFWIYFRNSEQQKTITERETALQKEKLIQLKQVQKNVALQAMLKGEEVERSRLAKELHDGIGVLLSSLKLSLNQLTGPEEQLTNTSKLVDKASSELRRIAHNMKPETLTKYGLITALEDLCDEINFNKELQVRFQHFDLEEARYQEIALQVYRIIQELLNNIIKHAKATQALVQLIQREKQLFVLIEDNGQGFDPTQKEGNGNGLQNVESRVKFINGIISWDSTENQGTAVSIAIELK